MNKEIKESIKNVVLSGMTIKHPYKSEISSWYSDISISSYNGFYSIHPFSVKFANIDDAVNYFCNQAFTSKNVGYIQSRLFDKKILNDYDHNLENPDKELKKLFIEEGKLVDEEAKALDIKLIEFPKAEDALKEFNLLIQNFNPLTIVKELRNFEEKYSVLDPFIGMSYNYQYEIDGSKHDFGSGFDYENYEPNDDSYLELDSTYEMIFDHIQISFRIRGDEEFYFFKVNP